MAEVLATYDYTLINDDTEYSIVCNNKETCTKAIIPSEYNSLPVTDIGTSAFENASELAEVEIPNTIKTMQNFAFARNKINDLYLPASLESITSYSLSDSFLKNVFVDKNNNYFTDVDGVLYNKDITSFLYYPSSHTNKSLILPDTITNIGKLSLCFANLDLFVIPERVTTIEIEPSYGSHCSQVVLLPSTPPSNASEDPYWDFSSQWYCKSTSLEAYKSAFGWSSYANNMSADDIRVWYTLNSIYSKELFIDKNTFNSKIALKQDRLTQSTDLTPTTQTLTLSANTRYALGALTALSLTFPSTNVNDGDEIIIEFVSGSTATNLTLDNVNAIYNFGSVNADKFVELNAQFKVSIGKWVVCSAETDYTAV